MPAGSQLAAALANLISGTFILCTQNKHLGTTVSQERLVRQMFRSYQSDVNFKVLFLFQFHSFLQSFASLSLQN